jgi:transporter family-2 protein
MPVQSGINLQLQRSWAGNPVMAALVSFAVGTVALAAYYAVSGLGWPSLSTVGRTSWHHWIGGFMGAYVVSCSVFLAPRLGAVTLMGLTVAGMMLLSIVLDHFGLLGYEVRQASAMRLLGAALLVAGVVLIRKF